MRVYLLSVFVAATVVARAQVRDSLAFSNLNAALRILESSAAMQYGTLGVSVRSVSSGRELVALNTRKSLPSASTLKLATTAAALEILGSGFRFHTFLEHDGAIRDGVLYGNLFIRGTGDPTLGSARFCEPADSCDLFREWLNVLQKAGISRITGNIVADDSYFDPQTIEDSWTWGDIGNYYGAGVSGLNWNENFYRIYFRPAARPGLPATLLRIEPEIPSAVFNSFVTTGPRGSGDKTVIRPGTSPNTFEITGTIPLVKGEFSIRGAMLSPASLLAHHFTGYLRQANIEINGSPSAVSSPAVLSGNVLLHDHVSPELSEICRQTNWWSVNLYAEAMLKTIGKTAGGKTDYASAVQKIKNFWTGQGMDTGGFYIKDGSGLSPSASVTVLNLTDILIKATRLRSFPSFYETLPVAGVSGTVRSKAFGTGRNIRAKSGSIEGTRAYAGLVVTRTGEMVAFAVIAHKYLPDSAPDVSRQLMTIVKLIGEL